MNGRTYTRSQQHLSSAVKKTTEAWLKTEIRVTADMILRFQVKAETTETEKSTVKLESIES